MAIEYTLLLKGTKLSEENVVNKLESLGYACSRCQRLPKGICIDLNEEIGFSVYLIDSGNSRYNVWETNFLDNDFVFDQFLQFRMSKEYLDFDKRYSVMLKIIFDLETELNGEAILVRNGDMELCLLRENQAILLNNESGIWNTDCFQDVITNRKVCYV